MFYYSGYINVSLNESLAHASGNGIQHVYFNDHIHNINKMLQKLFYFYLNDIRDPIYLQANGNLLGFNTGTGRYVGAYLKGQKTLQTIVESENLLNNDLKEFKIISQTSRADIPKPDASWKEESKILWKQYLHGDISLTHRNKTYDVLGSTRQYLYSVNTDDYEHPLLWVKDLFEELVQSKK